MSLQETPRAERVHIALFGRRNSGKSSVANAITGQALSVVSDVGGTTTDPVYKSMELLPIGPVVIIDTPGFDDTGALGALRVQRTRHVLEKTDVAVLVMDAAAGKTETDRELIRLFREREIPYVEVYNKADLPGVEPDGGQGLLVSAQTGQSIPALKMRIADLARMEEHAPPLVGDLIQPRDFVVLVTPIDSAAPKGRLILPQQQVLRDVLDSGAVAIVTKESELAHTLESLGKAPALIVTDSQAFAEVAALVPAEVPLTSFSILMARRKGLLDAAVQGIAAVDTLRDGDRVLVCEGCTHHRQCGDIGSVKIPRWLEKHTGKQLDIQLCSGADYPDDLSAYALVIHCGGCMLNERTVRYRVQLARQQGTPITNYGIAIARMKGILQRSLEMFPHLGIF